MNRYALVNKQTGITTELLKPGNRVNFNSQVIIVELKPVVWGTFRNFHGTGRYGAIRAEQHFR